MSLGAREELYLDELHPPISHYTHAVLANGMLYVSGILATRPPSVPLEEWTALAQTEAILADLGRVLAMAGSTPADVVRVTVYVTDMDDRPRINPARQRFFGEARPASTLVQVSALADPEAKLEIEAIALAGGAPDAS